MAVPKKRVSKSKTQLRKTKWREKALAEAKDVISSLRRDTEISRLWSQLRGKQQPNGDYPLKEGGVRELIKARAAEANQSSSRGFGSERRQQLLVEKEQLEKDQLSNEVSKDTDNGTDNV